MGVTWTAAAPWGGTPTKKEKAGMIGWPLSPSLTFWFLNVTIAGLPAESTMLKPSIVQVNDNRVAVFSEI